jgi:SAM-dependent MidA family methyltransferase
MNALHAKIAAQIAADGPMPVSTFMAQCLLDPAYGYYTQSAPFGTKGDFITAPEISQMFGELIGIWALNTWQQMQCPSPFALVEAGPGRGTLMADLLRATANHKGFYQALTVHLVEASPKLADQQRQKLAQHEDKITWHKSLDTLPAMPLIAIANELLDALPVRQCVKTQQGWRERCIGLDTEGTLHFVAGPSIPQTDLLPRDADTAEIGTIFEFAPARQAFTSDLAALLKTNKGAALLIDYGHLQTGFGDTLQAVKNHHFIDVLDHPGQADLTSHVDFDAIALAATQAGANALVPQTQGEFLLSLGLLERAGALGASKTSAQQNEIRAAVERLAGNGPNQMGDLFKVLCIASDNAPIFPFTTR